MRACIYVLIGLLLVLGTCCKNKNAQKVQARNTNITVAVAAPLLQPGADVTDYDGNIYHTIRISKQTWLAQNLKVTHYNNGDVIPLVMTDNTWRIQTSGACCNYENNEDNVNACGKLYNWHAVTDPRKLAPKGWHIPTEQEWKTMINYLGGNAVAGSKLSITDAQYWEERNNTATNETKFNGLPAGNRNNNGVYDNKGFSTTWWTATGEAQADFATNYSICINRMEIRANVDDRICGYSIRCVKD